MTLSIHRKFVAVVEETVEAMTSGGSCVSWGSAVVCEYDREDDLSKCKVLVLKFTPSSLLGLSESTSISSSTLSSRRRCLRQ